MVFVLIFSINRQNNKIRALEMIDFLIRNSCLTTSHKQGNGIPQSQSHFMISLVISGHVRSEQILIFTRKNIVQVVKGPVTELN